LQTGISLKRKSVKSLQLVRYVEVGMKYRVVKEDNLLDYVNLTQLAKKVGCSPAMLCRVRKGERVMSERLYQKVKKALKE